MHIRPIEDKDVDTVAALVTDRFMDDPKIVSDLEGVTEGRALLTAVAAIQLDTFRRMGDVHVLDGGLGMLAGHFRSKKSIFAMISMGLKIVRSAKRLLDADDRKRLKSNIKLTGHLMYTDWRKHAGKGLYYYIDLICISEKLKGSGAFRRLITPVLNRADAAKFPVLLDTHNPRNVPIFEHFGFKVIKEYQGKKPVKQYGMMRKPRNA